MANRLPNLLRKQIKRLFTVVFEFFYCGRYFFKSNFYFNYRHLDAHLVISFSDLLA